MVRAHPTVPTLSSAELLLESELSPSAAATLLQWRSVHPCLRILLCSPTIPPNFGPGGWMTVFRAGSFGVGWLLAMALVVSISPAAGQGYTPEQEQACTGDAFRLCSAEIPDVDRVTACMAAKQSQLSPPCRAQFRPDPEPREAAVRPAGRPTVIRPATPRKAVSAKPGKAKKPTKPAA